MPSAWSLTCTTFAFTKLLSSAARRAFSVVVPGITATVSSTSPATLWMPEPRFTSRLPPDRKVMLVKSTFSMRDSVMVLVPHSMSILPLATMSKRLPSVTAAYWILVFGKPGGLGRVFGYRPAQVDGVAGRLAVRADEGHQIGVLQMANDHRAAVVNGLERAGQRPRSHCSQAAANQTEPEEEARCRFQHLRSP